MVYLSFIAAHYGILFFISEVAMPVNKSEIELFKLLEQRNHANPPKPIEQQTIADFRAGAAIFLEFAGSPAEVNYQNTFVTARDGYQIPIRIYNNDIKEKKPVMIFYPGCGYVNDLFETNAIACSRIAKYAGIKVIVVNFRLAPEYPLPTSIYDAYDVTEYMAKHANEYQIDPEKIFIGGISSGAHAAAVISALARQESQFHIYHQILLNGSYDLTQSNHAYDKFEHEDKICVRNPAIDYIFNLYGLTPGDFKNPLFSPYWQTNFANFPPTTIIVAEFDGVRNDSEAYYSKLKNAGVNVEKIVLPGQTHNTFIMHGVMSHNEDPAKTIAEVILKKISQNSHGKILMD